MLLARLASRSPSVCMHQGDYPIPCMVSLVGHVPHLAALWEQDGKGDLGECTRLAASMGGCRPFAADELSGCCCLFMRAGDKKSCYTSQLWGKKLGSSGGCAAGPLSLTGAHLGARSHLEWHPSV